MWFVALTGSAHTPESRVRSKGLWNHLFLFLVYSICLPTGQKAASMLNARQLQEIGKIMWNVFDAAICVNFALETAVRSWVNSALYYFSTKSWNQSLKLDNTVMPLG